MNNVSKSKKGTINGGVVDESTRRRYVDHLRENNFLFGFRIVHTNHSEWCRIDHKKKWHTGSDKEKSFR